MTKTTPWTAISHSWLALGRTSRWPSIAGMGWVMVCIFFVNLITRMGGLDRIPSTITHDEVFYAVQAQTVALRGLGVNGVWQPLSLTSEHPLFAEWPGVLVSLGFLLPGVPNWLAPRLTMVIIGSILPILIGLIAHELFVKPRLTIIVTLVSSANPWLWQSSRLLYDSLFSVFFYVLGCWWLLSQRGWRRWGALLPFAVGFFQYQGHKILLVPVVVLCCCYVWWQHRPVLGSYRLLGQLATIVLMSVLMMGWFAWSFTAQVATSRTQNLLFTNTDFLTTTVDQQRLLSISNSLQRWFNNKATVLGREGWWRFTQTFDFGQWFAHGDGLHNTNSTWEFGYFYPISLVMFIVGLLSIAARKEYRPTLLWLMCLIAVAALPQAINVTSVWIWWRSSFLIPWVLLIIGYGWWQAWEYLPWPLLSRLTLLFLATASITSYAYDYLYRYPIYSAQGPYWAEHVLGEYLSRLPVTSQSKVLADQEAFVFLEYLFWANKINITSVKQIQQAWASSTFTLDNVSIATSCLPNPGESPFLLIADASVAPCPTEVSPPPALSQPMTVETKIGVIKIKNLWDGSTGFTIYNDQLCQPYHLTGSPQHQLAQPLSQLNDQEFCERYLSED